MSELSSAFPVSGGLYYWSFMLGGNYGPFVSWMVGWINLLGQVCYIMSPRLFVCLQACCTINTASARVPLPMHSTPGKNMLLLLLLWRGLLMVSNICEVSILAVDCKPCSLIPPCLHIILLAMYFVTIFDYCLDYT